MVSESKSRGSVPDLLPQCVPHPPHSNHHYGKGFIYLLDLSVGDLSGSVTTIRASPLVTVRLELKDPPDIVDLEDDRKCRINDDITLLWYDIIHFNVVVIVCLYSIFSFDISPCFYYEPLHSVDIPQFGESMY